MVTQTNSQQLTEVSSHTRFDRGMDDASKKFGLSDNSFTNNPSDVRDKACKLFQGYEIGEEFTHDPVRNLFLLAVADEWLSTDTVRERRGLLAVLKVLSVVHDDEGRTWNDSARVRELSHMGMSMGVNYDPGNGVESAHTRYFRQVFDVISQYSNPERKMSIMQQINRWDDLSSLTQIRAPLKEVRKNLGILSQDEEREFELHILEKKSSELREELGFCATVFEQAGIRHIVLPDDFGWSVLQHEYAHAQSVGINMGFQRMLFMALNEGITESVVSFPHSYPQERHLLQQICAYDMNLRDLLMRAYMGDQDSFNQFIIHIVRNHGLIGALAIARFPPERGQGRLSSMNDSVYLRRGDFYKRF